MNGNSSIWNGHNFFYRISFHHYFFIFLLLSIRGKSKFRSGKDYYFKTHETVAVLFIYSQVSYILCVQWKQRKKTTLNSQFRIKSTRIIFEFWNKVFKGNQQGVQIICVCNEFVVRITNILSLELESGRLFYRPWNWVDMCMVFFALSKRMHNAHIIARFVRPAITPKSL